MRLIQNPPLFADLPSCLLYLRGENAAGNTVFRDWSPKKRVVTNNGDNVVSSATRSKYPPVSQYYAGNTSTYLSVPGSADFILGGNWIATALVYATAAQWPTFWSQHLDANNFMSAGAVSSEFDILTYVASAYVSDFYTTTSAPVANTWHRFVFGQTSNTPFLYVDSTSVPLTVNYAGVTGNSAFNSTPLKIGLPTAHYAYTPTQYLDEIAIWSKNQGSVIPTAAQLNALRQRMIA